ncbi:hypothetical protein V1527DRAFT_522140 [Lipomyces starkeyi]
MQSTSTCFSGGNEALDINSNYGTKIHLVSNGSDWTWTAALAYIVAAFFVPRKEHGIFALPIINMALLAGLSWPTIPFMAGMQEIYVIAGLIGALVPRDYKWGYFTYGVLAFILVLYNLVYKLTTHFRFVVGSVGLVYLLHPIFWALSERGNVISPTSEGVFYGVLDSMALPLINSAAYFAEFGLIFPTL